ncbi:MAG: hypothetical protein Q9228_007981, partial [Teloschistes exilis]
YPVATCSSLHFPLLLAQVFFFLVDSPHGADVVRINVMTAAIICDHGIAAPLRLGQSYVVLMKVLFRAYLTD